MEYVRLRLSCAALALVSATACDAQLTPSYDGESLLTVTGRVEISAQDSAARLVPALAFPVLDRGEITIRDVRVQGQFPSDFRLDVFTPPPAAAFFNPTHQTMGEPRIALGYITALPSEHPGTLRYATEQTATRFGCAQDACDKPCSAPGCLVEKTAYCVPDDASVPCYTEELYCPTFQSHPEDCKTVATGGDPALKESPLRLFAGFSINYVVVDLESPAPADSVTAALLGSPGAALPAGYGLYALTPLTDEERAEKDACVLDAEMHAAVGFNEEFGTNLTTLHFETVCAPGAFGEQQPLAAPFCGSEAGQEELSERADAARERYIEGASNELGCAPSLVHVERVADPATQSVSVIIGKDPQPLSFLP